MRDSVYPHLVGSNCIEDEPAVRSALDGLCNLDDTLDIVLGQTRAIWANNFHLRTTGKNEGAAEKELTHRPNENKISDCYRERAPIEVEMS